ncbi:MAG TPA: APC family permease [Sporichthyaceae bacterium]|jgi:amino acid transporter|nr:APC family permease [Sporichthyaceae bacterium]
MVGASADRATPAQAGGGLRRDVGLAGLTSVSVGSVIGSGWLFGAQNAAALAGPAVLVSWVLAAVVCVVLALTYAELGAACPLSGGTARYTYLSHGMLGGFFAGWVSWLQAVTLAPVETVASLNYLSANWWPGLVHDVDGQHVLTGRGTAVAVGFVITFTLINLVGVRRLAEGNNLVVLWKIAIPVLTILVIATQAFHRSNFDLHGVHGGGGFAPFGLKGILLALSGGVLFSYQGFEQAVQLGGEARRPERDLPRAVLIAIVGGSLLYLALQVCFIAATDPHKIAAAGWAKLASNSLGPFYDLATVLGLTWLATILQLDAIISPGGTAMVYISTTSRLSFALGRTGAPASLARVNSRRVPWVGVVLAAVVGCLMFLPFGSWAKLVNYTTSATFFMYALAPVAVLTLRRALPDNSRTYRVPAARVWTPAAFALASLIVYWSGFVIDWRVGVAMLFGVGLLAAGRARQPKHLREALHPRAVAWIPVWVLGIIGLTAIGPDYVQGREILPFYLDMIVVVGFSLAIFAWAVRSALPAAAVRENLGRMRAEVESESAALEVADARI